MHSEFGGFTLQGQVIEFSLGIEITLSLYEFSNLSGNKTMKSTAMTAIYIAGW